MRVGASGAEGETAAGLAFLGATDAQVSGVVNEHVRVAGLDAGRAKFVVSDGAVNALRTGHGAAFALRVASFAFTIDGEVVDGALLDA